MSNFVLAQLCGSLHFMQDSLDDSIFLSINVKKNYRLRGSRCWVCMGLALFPGAGCAWGSPCSQALGVHGARLVPRCWVWGLAHSKVLGEGTYPHSQVLGVRWLWTQAYCKQWKAGQGLGTKLASPCRQPSTCRGDKVMQTLIGKCWGPTLNHIPIVKHIQELHIPMLLWSHSQIFDDLGVA